ncbi:MAG: hypothetical protein MJZ31_12655 [Bacteroidales bacterium]|nr:hypothetical protein [Bacteroidales bacterium]
MARVSIVHKCVTMARKAMREDSKARTTGRSIYIKRCPSGYFIMGVKVSKKQRNCRDMFADAQKLASYELKLWNKRRHWEREARRHKIKGAHRAAVSYFYGLLKEYGIELEEALRRMRIGRLKKKNENRGDMNVLEVSKLYVSRKWKEMDKASPFYYKKFGNEEEYFAAIEKVAA